MFSEHKRYDKEGEKKRPSLTPCDHLQGLDCGELQALLKHPALAEAAHSLLKPYGRALPALALPVQELARRLASAAGQLRFVQRCYTRLSFFDSRAVKSQGNSLVQARAQQQAVCSMTYRSVNGAICATVGILQQAPATLMQVYEFHDAQSGMLAVAQPPKGVSAASLVVSALSRALGSPLRLPLEPLLACSPEALPTLQHTLFGPGPGHSEHPLLPYYEDILSQCGLCHTACHL